MKPTLSIVTVVFNGEEFLEKTIRSVINQTYQNIEYIIIDGDSTDRTNEIITVYKKQIALVLRESDDGIYDAMNKGINLATGDFILFINAGDELFDIDVVTRLFENFDNEDAFYGNTQLVNDQGQAICRTEVPGTLTWNSLLFGMVISHQSIIISTKCINDYDLQYKVVSDHDWIISALKKCRKVKNSKLIISKYLVGGFSNQNFYISWRERLNITFSYYGTLGVFINVFLFIKAIAKRFIKKILFINNYE